MTSTNERPTPNLQPSAGATPRRNGARFLERCARRVVLPLSLSLAACSAEDDTQEEAASVEQPLEVIDRSQALAIVLPQNADPMFEGLEPPVDAPTRGMWSPVYDWPMNALHSVLLPNGRVLTYGTPEGNAATQDGRTLDVWDPLSGFGDGSHNTNFETQRVNSFCAGAAFQSDGSLLISGGNSPLDSNVFSPSTGTVTTSTFRMASERWYGTMLTLPDGRLLMMGGSGPYEALRAYQDPAQAIAAGSVSMTPEIYDPQTGFRSLFGAYSREAFGPDFHRYWYPRAWVGPDGSVFGISSEKMWRLDYSGDGSVTPLGKFKTGASATTRPNIGPTSAAVMFAPGRILQVGGNGYHDGHAMPGSALATIVDINGPAPVLTETSPMSFGRQWPNITVLPDGNVVVTGGTRYSNNGGSDAVFAAEIWDPTTGQWTVGASAAVIRVYHSAAILMPNGTVLSTGGGAPGPVNNLNAEVYYPPYLFRSTPTGGAQLAPRPRAVAVSTLSPEYGRELNLDLAEARTIVQAVLIGTGSTTHSFNTSQRRIELPFLQEANRVAVEMPANGNLAPPGYYEVFLIDDTGVPSPGVVVSLGGLAPPPVETELPRGTEVVFEAVNLPGHAMATNQSELGVLVELGDEPTPTQLQSAQFILRDGLADSTCVSFESVAVPGRWLRHYAYRLRLGTNDGSALFRADATFCPEKGLTGTGFSFRSKNFPARVIRHRDYQLWIDPVEDTDLFRNDATFVPRRAALPTIPAIDAPIAEVGADVSYSPDLNVFGASYSWDFGDGTTRAGAPSPVALHVFDSPGTYLVTFTVTLADGRTVSDSFVQAIVQPSLETMSFSSTQMVVSQTGSLFVVNPDNDSVSVFDTSALTKVAEVPVSAGPESVAIGPGEKTWVVSRDAASISVIEPETFTVDAVHQLPRGSSPFGLVFSPDRATAYVSLEGPGEIASLDPMTGTLVERVFVAPTLRGLAITADGSRLLASRFVTPPIPGEETTAPMTELGAAEVVAFDLPTLSSSRVISLGHSDVVDSSVSGRGIPNYLAAPVIAPDGAAAFVPSKQDNVARGVGRDGLNLDFQNTVRAITSKIDLSDEVELVADRLDLDDSGVASAAVFHPTGAYLFVALETSREVAVVSPSNGTELFRVPVGRAPQGLALSNDGTRLFVHNFMDRSLSVFDLAPLVQSGRFSLTPLGTRPTVASERLSSQVLLGKQLFYDAADPRLARDSYLSCASCHREGADDGRVWDLTGFGEGVRNTISLLGRAGTTGGPLHWSANFDEVQDFEAQIRSLSGGTGLLSDAVLSSGTVSEPLGDPKTGLSAELDALSVYVSSLGETPESPFRDGDALTPQAGAGRATFAVLGCNECHYGRSFSDEEESALVDIGTLTPASGQRLYTPLTGIDVPSLLGVWSTPPYLHDGSALTLAEAILAHEAIVPSATELEELVAFVAQIDDREPAMPRFGCTDGVANAGESDVDCGGPCAPCSAGASCLSTSDCQSGICTDQICEAAPSCDDDLQNGGESDVDCGSVCETQCAVGQICGVAADCDSGVCDAGACAPAPSCSDDLLNQDESDTDCGGVCPACEDGSSCSVASDCASLLCVAGACAPVPTCTDSLVNQNESDVDCGGVCPACADGRSCETATDCQSGICTSGTCEAAPTCSDALVNQDESDVDCGGSCRACSDGSSCTQGSDCESDLCSFGICRPAPTCSDALHNQNETDVDCGGICAACAIGQSCELDRDCATAYCEAGSCAPAPTCDDGLTNQDEPDTDCGGSCSACEDGAGCFTSEDCQSGICSAGICESLPALPTSIYLEAESGSLSGSPAFAVSNDAQAAGGKYIAPTANSLNSPGPNRATYVVDVAAGNYVLWGRVIAPNADDDSFWISVDGGSFIRWNNIRQTSVWGWDEVHNTDTGGAVVNFALSEGTHTIVVANREDGVRLDKLYLTANGDVPTGVGADVPPTCDDQVQNGDETGVDCGGSQCGPCLPASVRLAAEAAMFSGSPAFSVVSSAGANGGLAIAPSGNSYNTPGPNRAAYQFAVDEGTYVVWGRVRAPTPDDDSLWVSVDGRPFVRWNDIARSSGYVWDEVHNSDAGGARVTFALGAGLHTLEIANREDGVLLDELFIGQLGMTP